jgi:hypothetical protein
MPHGFVDKSKNSAPNHADKWLTLTKDDDYLAPLILHPTKGNPQATPPWQLWGLPGLLHSSLNMGNKVAEICAQSKTT